MNDYHVNLFEIAYLSDEQVSRFHSDFRLVADYFAQTRKNKGYTPPTQDIQHVHEFLQLMSVMTGDHRYEEVFNERLMKKGSVNMCQVLDQVENRGMEKGMEKGMQKGMEKGMQEGMQKGLKEGLKQGIKEGIKNMIQALREVDASEQVIASKLKEKYSLSPAEIRRYLAAHG